MNLVDLVSAAATKAEQILDQRMKRNENEREGLLRAHEGIQLFIDLLLGELANVGREQSPSVGSEVERAGSPEVKYLQHQGQDAEAQPNVQPEV